MLRFVPYVLKGLLRHRARTLLTLGGTAAALFVFVFIGAARQGVADMTRGPRAERVLVVFQAGRFCPSTSRLPEGYAESIAKVPGVRDVVPVQVFVNNCRATLDLVLFHGVPADKLPTRGLTLLGGDGGFDSDSAWVGRALAARRGLRPGGRFSVGEVGVRVAGIFSAATPAEENMLYAPLPYLQRARNGVGLVTQFEVALEDGADAEATARAIDAELRTQGVATDTKPRGLFQQGVVGDLAELVGWAVLLGYACVGLVLAMVAATAVMNVQDRLREHATLQAIGYTGWHVFGFVLGEGVAVGLAGGVLGTGLALGALWWTALAVGTEGVAIALAPSWSLAAEGMVAAALVGLLASVIPAWQASSAEIVTALREG